MSEPTRQTIASPVGPLTLVERDGRLVELAFDDAAPVSETPGSRVVRRIEAYFAGRIEALGEIDVAPSGTPFQLDVWDALRRIPAGATASYADVAGAIGRLGAERAVAAANAANPIAIVVPCHRVIHGDGSISGYGGGVERKRWLLRHEARHRPAAWNELRRGIKPEGGR